MKRLTAEQKALAERPDHVRFALTLADRFAATAPRRRDEIRSHALLGLVAAAGTFDPAAGKSFVSWVYVKVRGYVSDGLRAEDRTRFKRRYAAREVALPTLPDGATAPLPAADLPVGWAADSADAVERLLDRLPNKLRRLMRLRYLHGHEWSEIARRHGVTASRVLQLHRAALDLLRDQACPKPR